LLHSNPVFKTVKPFGHLHVGDPRLVFMSRERTSTSTGAHCWLPER
jgi:hypothetical protein